jgi:hypothetical protein
MGISWFLWFNVDCVFVMNELNAKNRENCCVFGYLCRY